MPFTLLYSNAVVGLAVWMTVTLSNTMHYLASVGVLYIGLIDKLPFEKHENKA